MTLVGFSIVEVPAHVVGRVVVVDDGRLGQVVLVVDHMAGQKRLSLQEGQGVHVQTRQNRVYLRLGVEVTPAVPVILPAHIAPPGLLVERVLPIALVLLDVVHALHLLCPGVHLLVDEQVGPVGREHVAVDTSTRHFQLLVGRNEVLDYQTPVGEQQHVLPFHQSVLHPLPGQSILLLGRESTQIEHVRKVGLFALIESVGLVTLLEERVLFSSDLHDR